MTSGSRAFPHPSRYSRSRRVVIVSACAVALSGTAMALPAATFASGAGDTPIAELAKPVADDPIAKVSIARAELEVPDVGVKEIGVPLPAAEVDTEELGLPVPVVVETAPEPAATTAEEPAQPERTARQMGPHSAVTAAQPTQSRPAQSPPTALRTSTRVVEPSVSEESDDGAGFPAEQRAVVRAAAILAAEKTAPALRSGLGLAAPFAGIAPEGSSGSRDSVHTLNLAADNAAPSSANGDWDLMPEVGFAAIPLALAAMVVIAQGRRGARVVAAPTRRRHASS